MIIYTPYTYLIGWSNLNTWYYGVRFAKKTNCLYETGCHPDELWQTYFTSSSYVSNFIKEHGDPDVIEVRKTFPEKPEEAREWETKVLKRLGVKDSEKWLNKSDNISIDPNCTVKKHSEESKRKISTKMKGKVGNKNSFFGRHHSDETKQKLSDDKKGVPSGMKPMLGKTHSDETRKKISAGGKGKKRSESFKKNLSDQKKGVPRPKVTCPHCSLVGAIGIMSRWHFDNCKLNVSRFAGCAV